MLIALERFRLSRSAEASLIDKVGKLLCHHLFDFFDCCLEIVFVSSCYVEVERWIL